MTSNSNLVDFIYIGAPRCGSTWLSAALDQHPGIYVPHNKEIHFFNDRLIYSFEYKYPLGINTYKKYFQDAKADQKKGELSPFYYSDPNCAYRIAKHSPNTKIICFLRNPADMLFSLYLLVRDRERREKTFEKELEKNPQWLDLIYFYRALLPFYDWFPKENIFVGIYEEFFQDEKSSLTSILRFIGVESIYQLDVFGLRINSAPIEEPSTMKKLRGSLISILNHHPFIPIKNMMHKMKINRMDYSGVKKDITMAKPQLNPQTRAWIMDQCAPDIARLESLLYRKLNCWE